MKDKFTCGAGGVEGLVGLDEDVPRLVGHQYDSLQCMLREFS